MLAVADLVFFGSPYSPLGTTSNDAFQAEELGEEHNRHALAAISACRGGIDVLVTHSRSPMFDLAARKSRVWAYGHFHDQYGILIGVDGKDENTFQGCVFVNVANCDMIYRPVHPTVVIDIEPRQRACVATSITTGNAGIEPRR